MPPVTDIVVQRARDVRSMIPGGACGELRIGPVYEEMVLV